MKNFTNDRTWRQIINFRYPTEKIFSSKNLDFVDREDFLECIQKFDMPSSAEDYSLIDILINIKEIKFKYLNSNSKFLKYIYNKYTENFEICTDSEWKNPILKIKKGELSNYIQTKDENIKRDFKKFLKNSKIYRIKNEMNQDFYELWQDILEIDQNSWKKESETDMFNLEYEHLQYMFFCLKNNDKYYIDVLYDDNKRPLGYSFIFEYDSVLYAAKWGATEDGRKINAGITCFFNQLNRINNHNDIILDTWSRCNMFFEKLSNFAIERKNLSIRRK